MNKSLRIVLAMAALLTGLGTVKAQDNLDYYWVQTSGNNWNEIRNWRVLRAATETTPAEYVEATELPDATNAVFINGVTPAGPGLPTPVSIPQNAPTIVNIEVGTVGSDPLADAPFVAKSISFGGTIPNNTSLFFTVNQPLTVGTPATPGDVTVGYKVAIRTENSLTINGALTFGTTAGNSTFTVNQQTATITNAVNVAAPTIITVNRNFSAGSLSFANTAGASTFAVGRATAPAITGASATISRAVSVGSAAIITTHPNNSLSIGGTLSLTSTGARFNINGAVTLGGSLVVAVPANITGTTGSVNFASTGTENTINVTAPRPSQTPIMEYGVTFNVPVTFSRGGQWTLGTNMIVSQQVNFNNGYLIAPTYSFTRSNNNNTQVNDAKVLVFTAPAAAMPSGASGNSHVVGFVHKIGLVGEMTMPIGAGPGMYRPIIARMSATNPITARYFNASPDSNTPTTLTTTSIRPISNTNSIPQLRSVSNREYWFITSNESSGLRIDLNYNRPNVDGENPSSEQYYFMNDPWRRTLLTVAAWHRNDRAWFDLNLGGPSVVDPVAKTIRSNGSLAQTEYFTIGTRGQAPLPVKLVSFSAQQLDGQVKLKWQSAEEKNTAHFEVERSADGKNFSPLLTRKAQGNSAALVSYNAIDNNPLVGTSYYRLKMVDLDGTFEHSRMVSVSTEGGVLVRAYPNPANGREVRFLAPNGDKLVLQSVTDAFGKAVEHETTDVYAEGLYVSFYGSLPAGFYVATLVTDDDRRERVRVKFVVQ